jgi:hypothetical protein
MTGFKHARWLVVLAVLSGCATKPENIATAAQGPEQYRSYDCKQIEVEAARISRLEVALHKKLAKTAETDAKQAAIGVLFFLPTLMWLEGEDGPEARLYAQTKGSRAALTTAAAEKNCPAPKFSMASKTS